MGGKPEGRPEEDTGPLSQRPRTLPRGALRATLIVGGYRIPNQGKHPVSVSSFLWRVWGMGCGYFR